MREVNKLTSAGNTSDTINTTADKLFLLSEIEIFGGISYSKSGEGTQYDYYKAGNSMVKSIGGRYPNPWWERSPYFSNYRRFCNVDSGGTIGYAGANSQYGIAFAFCL